MYSLELMVLIVQSVRVEMMECSVQFSSRWLLHQLIVYLDVYMMHKCVHMKYGTVLYRKGADILETLSWVLSISHLADHWSESKHPNTEKTLKEASTIMNNLIHEEIKKSSQVRPTFDCTSLKKF